jgi:alkylation response protein AidB-like acyl-CoA dehydrogenase
VGEENQGWYIVATALDFERIGVFPVARVRKLFDQLVEFIKTADFGGYRPKDDPDVRRRIADLSTELEVAQMLSYRAAWMVSKGQVPNYEAAAVKIFGTELQQRVTHAATLMLGMYGQLIEQSPHAPKHGFFETMYEAAVMPTFGAGSNEVLRQVIATRGMGLPRG